MQCNAGCTQSMHCCQATTCSYVRCQSIASHHQSSACNGSLLQATSPAYQHIAKNHRAADAGDFNGQLIIHSSLPVILLNKYVKPELCTCRLWPPLDGSLDPKELEPVVAATVACFVDNGSNIVWIPDSPEGLQGRWVSCKEACFLPSQAKLSPQVIAAGRRAGLLIPDMPENAQWVSTCLLAVLFTPEGSFWAVLS